MSPTNLPTSADTRVAVVRGALEAILSAKRKQGLSPTVGASALEVSEHLSLELPEVRNLLARAERAGFVHSIVLQTQGHGRRNSRQTFKRKFYYLAKVVASDSR